MTAVMSIEQTLRDRYAAARRSLFTAPKKAPAPPKPVLTIVKPEPVVHPHWKDMDSRFDHHVMAWLAHKASPMKAYVKSRCAEMGVEYREIVSGRRQRKIITVKHMLMFEVWSKFRPSNLELARTFNLSDHTSAIHAVNKYLKHGFYSFNRPRDKADMIKDMWVMGKSIKEIATETGCAYSSISLYAKKQGWKRR